MTLNASQQSDAARIGEVIDASTTEFTAQCYRLYEAPALGSLVRCGEDVPIYAIVCESATQSLDPARHTIPRGIAEPDEAGVFRSNPQIERLLYTRFRAVIVGYRDHGVLRRYLPPNAPRMYAFVTVSAAAELAEFSSGTEFIPLLLAAPVSAQDDVIAAFLRQASAAQPDRDAYLVSAGKSLATALGGQTHRLSEILRRLQ